VLQDRCRFPVSLGMVRVAWLCLVRSVRVCGCAVMDQRVVVAQGDFGVVTLQGLEFQG
jgi:hypothetical protein